MENRKEKKFDLGKAIQNGMQQLTKEVKEIVKDIKSSASEGLENIRGGKVTSTPSTAPTSTKPYYEEKKITSVPELKCELCHLEFSEELIRKYLEGKDIICERCGQPFGEKPESDQSYS